MDWCSIIQQMPYFHFLTGGDDDDAASPRSCFRWNVGTIFDNIWDDGINSFNLSVYFSWGNNQKAKSRVVMGNSIYVTKETIKKVLSNPMA